MQASPRNCNFRRFCAQRQHFIVSKSPVPMPTAQKKSGSGLGCVYVLLVAFALLVAFGVFSFTSRISGTEFTPNTFQTRSFSYSRIPGTRTRLSPTSLGPPTAVASIDVLKHLPTLNRTQQWQVASVVGAPGETHGANVLANALNQRSPDGNDVWGAWSVRHPTVAAVFWPLVQQVAFQQLYECIPELLQIAELADDPVSLERESLSVIVRATTERIKRSNEDAQSTELLDWLSGISVKDPENSGWLTKQKDELLKSMKSVGP